MISQNDRKFGSFTIVCVMSGCFVQVLFGSCRERFGHGLSAWCCRAKHQTPGEASLGNQGTVFLWTKEKQLSQQEKKGFNMDLTTVNRRNSAWTRSRHACCLPPPGHLGDDVPNSCSGKKDGAGGQREMQNLNHQSE